MATTKNSPAADSYARERDFHQQTWKSGVIDAMSRRIPKQWRQRIRLRRRLELLREYALDGVDAVLGRQKEMVPPRHLNFVGHGDFEEIGNEFFRYFTELCCLKADDDVLEIGCGVGRMARPLTRYLTRGSYHGIDIVPKAIRWCERNITRGYPQFHFYHANIHNLAYNPSGQLQSVEYRFPFEASTFDFAFLTSVFSHMLAAEMNHYLSQTARCMRSQGKCLFTFFLLNDESCELIERGLSPLKFKFRRQGCYVNDDAVPEYAVAYREGEARRLLQDAGLAIDAVRYGAWCGRENFLSYQDIVIAHKVR